MLVSERDRLDTVLTDFVVASIFNSERETAERRGFVNAVRALRRFYKSPPVIVPANYPTVPPPEATASFNGYGLPSFGGVYFVWSSDRIVYVGQSQSIINRAVVPGHQGIERGDGLSWIRFDNRRDRLFAECFYIGTIKPERNLPNVEQQTE